MWNIKWNFTDMFHIKGYILWQRTITLTFPVHELSALDWSEKWFLTCSSFTIWNIWMKLHRYVDHQRLHIVTKDLHSYLSRLWVIHPWLICNWFLACSYPHAFLKKRWGYCNRLRPSVCPSVRPSVCPSVRPSVTLSPPKPLDEIQPNLVCGLLTWMGRATAHFFLAPPPGALGRGPKVKYH